MSADLPIQMFDLPRGGRRTKRVREKGEFRMLLVRMPPDLFELIDKARRANYRSKTAETIQRLRASFEGESINEHGVIVSTRPALTSDQKTGGHRCA